MKTLIKYLIILPAFCFTLHAQSITAEKILENVKTQFDKVQDYTATITATINIERLHIPQMTIKIYFKQPNKVHIESKNFAMVPREGIALNPTDLLNKFEATLVETENDSGRTVYKLRLISKPEENKVLTESYIWIDGTRWVVTKFESMPTAGRTVEIAFTYETVDGKYTLPSTMTATFDFSGGDSFTQRKQRPGRMPSKGTVEVKYSDYSVNTGLSDEIFEKKQEKTDDR